MFDVVLDALFPRRCGGCGASGWPFCPTCRGLLVALTPPGCRRCGRPLEEAVDRCGDCPPPGPDWTRAGLLYGGPARAALIRLKFAGHRTLAQGLAGPLAHAWRWTPMSPLARPWTVTWVPLGPRRRRQRGFDQARALAGAFARAEGLPLLPLLRRVRETAPQARRSGPERRVALHGAFEPAGRPCPPRVILVDDVLTSGATAAECCAALRAAGARHVGVLTVARSLNGALPARCYNPPGLQPGSVVARETFSR